MTKKVTMKAVSRPTVENFRKRRDIFVDALRKDGVGKLTNLRKKILSDNIIRIRIVIL